MQNGVMLTVIYAGWHLCWVLQVSSICCVSLSWMSLCWVSLSWMLWRRRLHLIWSKTIRPTDILVDTCRMKKCLPNEVVDVSTKLLSVRWFLTKWWGPGSHLLVKKHLTDRHLFDTVIYRRCICQMTGNGCVDQVMLRPRNCRSNVFWPNNVTPSHIFWTKTTWLTDIWSTKQELIHQKYRSVCVNQAMRQINDCQSNGFWLNDVDMVYIFWTKTTWPTDIWSTKQDLIHKKQVCMCWPNNASIKW